MSSYSDMCSFNNDRMGYVRINCDNSFIGCGDSSTREILDLFFRKILW